MAMKRLSLRITGVSPLIGQIRADTGVSNGVAGLLTTLPLLAFGLLSPVAPRLARRFGMERTVLASLLLLAAGILLRSAGAVATLFLGTGVLGAAIVVGNVLLPGLVKREFPERAGLMTSVYTTALGISAALAAGVSVPVAQLTGIGWRARRDAGLIVNRSLQNPNLRRNIPLSRGAAIGNPQGTLQRGSLQGLRCADLREVRRVWLGGIMRLGERYKNHGAAGKEVRTVDSNRGQQQDERSTEPANPREHVREMEEHLREMGEYLRRMGERMRHLDEQLSHLEAQDDSAIDSGKGWPTGG